MIMVSVIAMTFGILAFHKLVGFQPIVLAAQFMSMTTFIVHVSVSVHFRVIRFTVL